MGRFVLVQNIVRCHTLSSPGCLVTGHDDAGPDQRRAASKYIDTPPRVTGDKLVRAASDASDEAAIESCDQTVWAAQLRFE